MTEKRQPYFPQLERLGFRGPRRGHKSYRWLVPVDEMIENQDNPQPERSKLGDPDE